MTVKLNTLIAAIVLATASSAVQAHDYINQVAQARDSLVQARDMFQGIACRVTDTDVHNNMITCSFARAIDNGLKWIDEIKPGDTNAEAKRKIQNASAVMMQPDEETIKAIWTSPKVKPHEEDFAVALTLSMNVSGYLGVLFIDPKGREYPVPTRESVTKMLKENN